jgi:hypothetical protein
LTGESVYKAVLRPLDLCPPRLGAPILAPAEEQQMSWLTGSGERAVVADFSSGSDRLALVTPDGLAAIPGLGNPVGHSPALASDGRLAFADQQPGKSGPQFRLRMFDPASTKTTTLLTLTTPPSNLAWGPDGQLALIADTGSDGAHLLVLDVADAKARRVADLPREAVSVLWASWGGFVVVLSSGGDPTTAHAVVLNASGKQVAEVAREWRPLGLMDDGALIAANASGELFRLAAPTYDVSESFGSSAFTGTDAIWQVVT